MPQQPRANSFPTFRFDVLAIWQTKLPGVKHALLPPSNGRPNPLVTASMVVASIFSPGAVFALERRTGRILWQKQLSAFGDAAIYEAGGMFFVKVSHTLHAINPKLGDIIWSFCPYGPTGETMYSSPTVHGKLVFIGDRRGFLHCLDVQTGETRWRQRTNRAANDDVNSTPLVLGGLVIVGTNANRAVAYHARTGERAWVRKLDGPSAFGPLAFQEFVAVFTNSIYLLKPQTGTIVRRFSWKNDGIRSAGNAQTNLIGILKGKWPPVEDTELVGVNKLGPQFSSVLNSWGACLRYVPETKLVYVSHLDGISACRPDDGGVVFAMKLPKARHEGTGLVDVKKNVIYALTGKGRIFALRHPKI